MERLARACLHWAAAPSLLALLFLSTLPSRGAELSAARKDFISGQYSNCIAACREALADYAYNEEWHELLTRSQFTIGDYEGAGASISNALQRFSWSMPLRLLALEVLPYTSQTNRIAEVTDEIERLIAARSDMRFRDAAAVVAFGRAALHLGADPRKVLDNLFEEAKRKDPSLRDAYLAIGELALNKHDYDLAAKQFSAGLKKFPKDADMHFGLARAFQPSDRRQMLANLDATLEANTNHAPSLLLLVDHLIDGEDYVEAEELIERVLQVNPHHPEAWAFQSVVFHLRNDADGEKSARDKALKFHPRNPRVDYLIGQNLSQKYRFAEGAACQRRALAADTNYVAAKAQLAMDLLRLGDEAEGWRLAEEAHKDDAYDVTLFNLVTLKDKLRKFSVLTNESFVVRMGTNEAPIYGREVLGLLARAKDDLCAKYNVPLAKRTTVEIFPEQKDFGVRTFGMPDNPGFLGVCFGPVITANSPASQTAQPANWQAVLWHEFMHVLTLQMTRNKMPRWLSEGISVYEELQENPAWGQRMTAQYRDMILNGDLTPLSELSSAFLAPKTPMHLQFAYYESALAVEYLVTKHGFDALRKILTDLGEGVAINDAISAHTAPVKQLDTNFATFVIQRAKNLAPELDWKKPTPAELRSTNWLAANPTNFWALHRRTRDLLGEKKPAEAKELAQKLVAAYPSHTGPDSGWMLLAQACGDLGDTGCERSALETVAAMDADAVDAFARLIEIGTMTKDWKLVRLNAERSLAVNPLIMPPHRALATAADALKDVPTGIRENQIVLRLDPHDPAEVHYNLGRLLHANGDAVAAKRHVLQALEEAPRYRKAHLLLKDMRQSAPAARATPE